MMNEELTQEEVNKLRNMYPDFTEDELIEAGKNLNAYAEVLYMMFKRMSNDGTLERLIEEKKNRDFRD